MNGVADPKTPGLTTSKDSQRLIRQNTPMIYICTPHNPTGLLMPRDVLTQVVELCRSGNIILFSDEVFRELEHIPPPAFPLHATLSRMSSASVP